MRHGACAGPGLSRGVAAALLTAVACGPSVPLDVRVERDLLERERAALRRELSAAGAPDHRPGAAVGVHASLLDRAVELALPVEVAFDGYRIAASAGGVELRGGLAVVRLAARVSRDPDAGVSVDVDVVGILRVVGVEDGRLTAAVEVLGLETRELRVGGLSPPVGRLLDEVARRPTGDLNRMLERVEIPVRLAETIVMPRVEEDELTIEAATLPLRFQLHHVSVGRERLWVFLDVEAGG